MIDPEYSPFIDWNPNDPISADSLAKPFIALVSMVRDGYHCDEMIEEKAHSLFSLFNRDNDQGIDIEELLKSVGWSDDDSLPGYSRLSRRTSFPEFCQPLTCEIFIELVRKDNLSYFSSDAAISAQSIQDIVLHKCLIPIAPSLAQITHNPHLVSWINEYKETVQAITYLFDVNVFHQPTLNFVRSSRLPIVFTSLLSTVEVRWCRNLAQRENVFADTRRRGIRRCTGASTAQ
ncbi:hypothetical protein BLNAU_18467 [Blattamonas nauphoetae]|uniref:EF-hand domain-containing protein n=1 Tax=Blattamonas nauphoetae TaxID=2049346 RepID=A0ABQ9X8R6_9EUKA|nr:hypothetical protein BLNAU_18467 [Blattamonas nauphoetae]